MASVTINIIDGIPPFTVVINPGNIVIVFNDGGEKVINDLPEGEYTISVTDSLECYDDVTVNVSTTTTTTTDGGPTTTTTTTTEGPTTTTTTTTSTTTMIPCAECEPYFGTTTTTTTTP